LKGRAAIPARSPKPSIAPVTAADATAPARAPRYSADAMLLSLDTP
jgi:hypothetical protein